MQENKRIIIKELAALFEDESITDAEVGASVRWLLGIGKGPSREIKIAVNALLRVGAVRRGKVAEIKRNQRKGK